MTEPTIDILICTIGERINNVGAILLEQQTFVRYVVSWQNQGNAHIPEMLLERSDVSVFKTEGRGLSANRNNALAHAHADLLVIADDDARLDIAQLRNLQSLFLAHPETDIYVLQALTYEGAHLHYYPEHSFSYPNVPTGFYFSSMGLVLRGDRRYPLFDTRFGLGAPRLGMGEEEIFIHDCHKRKLRITYYPEPLLATEGVTTSSHYASDSSLQRAKGAVTTVLHGPIEAVPRFVYIAIRMRTKVNPIKHIMNLLSGMVYILCSKRK